MSDKANIYLPALVKKLITEYERTNQSLLFTIKKKNDVFIFSWINEALLNLINVKEEAIVGTPVHENDYIAGESYEYVMNNIKKAWEGQDVLYYFVPETNNEVYLLISLVPAFDDFTNVLSLNGSCFPLPLEEIQHDSRLLQEIKRNK